MSTETGPPTVTPKSPPRRAICAAYALATSVLVGMQPVLTQVPPNSLRSTSATFMPAAVRRPAREGPACPAPMTIASKNWFMVGVSTMSAPPRIAAVSSSGARRAALCRLPQIRVRYPKKTITSVSPWLPQAPSAAELADMESQSIFNITWPVEATFHQRLNPGLTRRALDGGDERTPLERNVLVGRQARLVHQALDAC